MLCAQHVPKDLTYYDVEDFTQMCRDLRAATDPLHIKIKKRSIRRWLRAHAVFNCVPWVEPKRTVKRTVPKKDDDRVAVAKGIFRTVKRTNGNGKHRLAAGHINMGIRPADSTR